MKTNPTYGSIHVGSSSGVEDDIISMTSYDDSLIDNNNNNNNGTSTSGSSGDFDEYGYIYSQKGMRSRNNNNIIKKKFNFRRSYTILSVVSIFIFFMVILLSQTNILNFRNRSSPSEMNHLYLFSSSSTTTTATDSSNVAESKTSSSTSSSSSATKTRFSHNHDNFQATLVRSGYNPLMYFNPTFTASPSADIYKYTFLQGYVGVIEPAADMDLMIFNEGSSSSDSSSSDIERRNMKESNNNDGGGNTNSGENVSVSSYYYTYQVCSVEKSDDCYTGSKRVNSAFTTTATASSSTNRKTVEEKSTAAETTASSSTKESSAVSRATTETQVAKGTITEAAINTEAAKATTTTEDEEEEGEDVNVSINVPCTASTDYTLVVSKVTKTTTVTTTTATATTTFPSSKFADASKTTTKTTTSDRKTTATASTDMTSSTSSSSTTTTIMFSGLLKCIYIRREIRSLSESDKNKTMNAMYELWNTNDEDGIAKYGDKYRSAHYLVKFHYFNAAWQEGDHIHEGNGFLPQHLKMTNIFEESMQSVDKSVSLPYWDSTIEMAQGLSVFDSPVFTADTFGSLPAPKDEYWGWSYTNDSIADARIPDGRWANIQATMNTEYPELEFGYGFLRAPWNLNPSQYISRFTSTNKQFPTCSAHYDMLNYTKLTDFLRQSPYEAHASTHGVAGGLFGCDLLSDLREQGFINSIDSQINICKNWAFYIKEMYRDNLIIPKKNCSLDGGSTSSSSSSSSGTSVGGENTGGDSGINDIFAPPSILNTDIGIITNRRRKMTLSNNDRDIAVSPTTQDDNNSNNNNNNGDIIGGNTSGGIIGVVGGGVQTPIEGEGGGEIIMPVEPVQPTEPVEPIQPILPIILEPIDEILPIPATPEPTLPMPITETSTIASVLNLENNTDFTLQNCGFTCTESAEFDTLAFFLTQVLNSDYETVPRMMQAKGWKAWVDFICYGDAYKIFAGDHLESASPADPSFWPIHPTLERLLQVKYMAGGFESDEWPTDVDTDYICDKSYCYNSTIDTFDTYDYCCYGHYQHDQLLDATTGNRNTYFGLTNNEMMQGTNPTLATYSMTYIYDNFDWSHCTEAYGDEMSFHTLIQELPTRMAYLRNEEVMTSKKSSASATAVSDENKFLQKEQQRQKHQQHQQEIQQQMERQQQRDDDLIYLDPQMPYEHSHQPYNYGDTRQTILDVINGMNDAVIKSAIAKDAKNKNKKLDKTKTDNTNINKKGQL